jgi:hypothetical protein
LETALDGERDAGSSILPFRLVVKLAKDSSLPISDDEEINIYRNINKSLHIKILEV